MRKFAAIVLLLASPAFAQTEYVPGVGNAVIEDRPCHPIGQTDDGHLIQAPVPAGARRRV
jgi:hypothetical protein